MFEQIYEKNEGEGMRFCVLCDGEMLGVISISSLQEGGEMSGISAQIGSKVRAKKLIVNYGILHPQKNS